MFILCHFLVSRAERRKYERQEQTAARRRDWNERYAQRRSATYQQHRGTPQSSSASDLNQYISSHSAVGQHSEYGTNRHVSGSLHARPNAATAASSAAASASGADSATHSGSYQGSVNNASAHAPSVQVVSPPTTIHTLDSEKPPVLSRVRQWFSRSSSAAATAGKKSDDVTTVAAVAARTDDARATAATQLAVGGDPSVYSVTDGIVTFIVCLRYLI